MGLTNFPNGVSSFGVPVLPGSGLTTTGSVFFVDSATGSDGNLGTGPDKPFATVDYAVGKCTANKGDIIYVMPNHAETLTTAGDVTLDIAGISVIGLGTYNQRPNFLMDAAAATWVVSAADVKIQNIVFTAGFADVVACIGVTAVGAHIDECEFVDNTTDENFLTPIKATGTTDGEANGLKVTGCKWTSVDAACVEFIEANADITGLVVRDNMVCHEGTASPLVLFATGKDAKYAFIAWNFLSHKMTANELLVNIDTTGTNNSGFVAHNRVRHADVTTSHDLGIDSCGFGLFDNLSVSTNALSGVILPAADVDS